MWKLKHLFMNADAGADAGGNGDADKPDTGDAGGNSLLSTGATDQAAEGDFIPEKYRTSGADGKFNLQDSARKLADAYSHLSKRFGSGDVPSKNIPRR